MTREEKLKILRTTVVTPDMHPDDFGKWDEALRSAIQALSAIEDIKAEITRVVEEENAEDAKWAAGLRYSLKIIDKHISGKESE